ncbi:carbonic anhydrase [Angomonas deanei]|uniref:Carbonic anhydrase n=1 Tax=Angomonas deanei TaxID=59799 RepID=A0A7G2CN96_9TRYP|nr:carbonic anhydrase [Angomonas deanei]CAD2220063.1 Carbonic anhydrase, putative [Angomonas deanei]|eukprot:EPY40950.1 carbonic anhydrase [Angomonas deanei]
MGGHLVQSLQREQPPRGSGIQPLLDYNKQWAGEISRVNPEYFYDLAKQQTPQYLWIGCSDSRVPANEIVGLYPGDVFVHRNIANVVCNSDLNALAVLQYSIECLKVEHVIVTGHYKCGGVTAALNDTRIGLADHWILHVSAVRKRHWKRMVAEIPKKYHLDALCELNVIAQVESVVETHLMQRIWKQQNIEDMMSARENRPNQNRAEDEVEIHGWVYGLEDGMVRPLLSLNRRSNIEKCLGDAVDALFWRYGLMS